jgi:hypothetical protein
MLEQTELNYKLWNFPKGKFNLLPVPISHVPEINQLKFFLNDPIMVVFLNKY